MKRILASVLLAAGVLGLQAPSVGAQDQEPHVAGQQLGDPAASTGAGGISGTVTADGPGTPLESVQVCANDDDNDVEECANTAPDGTYTVGGLSTGSYRVSFTDWEGGFLSEYFDGADYGSATLVDVTAPGNTPNIDARLRKGGSISGTVTADGAGNPLYDIRVCADGDGLGGSRCANTEPDGSYTIGSLPTDSYRVSFTDWEGGFLSEYFDGADYGSATLVDVTAPGNTPNIGARLRKGGSISGTVTEDGTGDPLAGIEACVGVDDFGFYRCVVSGASGAYTIAGVSSGDYVVKFRDDNDVYLGEFFDDVTDLESASPVSVTNPDATTGIDAALEKGGVISGTVTDRASSGPIADIEVCAVNNDDEDYAYHCATTAGDGTYAIGALPTATYTVEFDDYAGGYANEYFDHVLAEDLATPVAVTAPVTTTDIDAALDMGAVISGKITDHTTGDLLDSIEVCAQNAERSVYRCGYSFDGNYTITGLPSGSYTVQFYDPGGRYAPVYFGGALDQASATPVSVTAPDDTPGINAVMTTACSAYHGFTDVTAGVFYECAVAWLVRAEVTAGTAPGKYSPNQTLSRAEMVVFLYRLAGSPAVGDCSVHSFTDVAEGAFHECAVTWAVQEGITAGTSATKFSSWDKVDRGQMVVFLHRLAGSPPVSNCAAHPFTDVVSNAYYQCAMAWAVEAGVTNGVTATTFVPSGKVSRWQMATFLWRYSDSPNPWEA